MPEPLVATRPDKEAVSWRLPKPLMVKARAKAHSLGLSITTYVTLLMSKDLEGEN